MSDLYDILTCPMEDILLAKRKRFEHSRQRGSISVSLGCKHKHRHVQKEDWLLKSALTLDARHAIQTHTTFSHFPQTLNFLAEYY